MSVSTKRMEELFRQWDKESHLPESWQYDKTRFREQRKWRDNLSEDEKVMIHRWDNNDSLKLR